MSSNDEVIALLLGEGSDRRASADLAAGAQRLVRSADGRVSLEAVPSEEEFVRDARGTGCFRRGKPIVDPETREVIGYEMEQVEVDLRARRKSAFRAGATPRPAPRLAQRSL
ncbi:MAG TPA: hypothetical protein VF329_08960 [Gammaproteobacteria bacterium]